MTENERDSSKAKAVMGIYMWYAIMKKYGVVNDVGYLENMNFFFFHFIIKLMLLDIHFIGAILSTFAT